MKSVDEIIADFDAIAGTLGEAAPRRTLTPTERSLLDHVPHGARVALEVGCGDGVVTRALARRGLRVLAIDVSPRMIALARERTPRDLDVRYCVSDFMAEPVPAGQFDVVVSINTVHHLVLADVVARLAALVAPGGRLLIQDVVARPGMRYFAPNVAGVVRRRVRQLFAGESSSRTIAALYARHGKGETYLTPDEAEGTYRALLPGVRVEHHLEWRYSAIWERGR